MIKNFQETLATKGLLLKPTSILKKRDQVFCFSSVLLCVYTSIPSNYMGSNRLEDVWTSLFSSVYLNHYVHFSSSFKIKYSFLWCELKLRYDTRSSKREEWQKDRKTYLKSYLIGNCLFYILPHCLRQHFSIYLVLILYSSPLYKNC